MNSLSLQFVARAIDNIKEDQKCTDLHSLSCNVKALDASITSIKAVSKLYFIVHMIPLVLKLKKTMKNPKQYIKKFLIGYIKSLIFAGGTLFLIRRSMCFLTEHFRYNNSIAIIAGFICGPALLLEPQGRRIEISLYCLNKGIEMLYYILSRRYTSLWIKNGQIWLFSLSLALISYYFLQNRSYFGSSYQSLLNLVFSDI